MQLPTRASSTKNGAGDRLVAGAKGHATHERRGAGRIALGVAAGLLLGAVGGYLLASAQFDERVAAITQASELRISAKNDRIRELEEQQRESARHADEQERELAEQASAQERALIARADERERRLAKPDLPIRVWARKAFAGTNMVARLHNFGEKDLVLAVTARSGQTNQRASWSVAIAPNGTQVIGKDEGWTFAVGDEIDLASGGYRPMTFRVPQPAKQ